MARYPPRPLKVFGEGGGSGEGTPFCKKGSPPPDSRPLLPGAGMTRQYGIIGYPLGHSLSPLVHNRGFRRFGIPAEYTAWPTPPEDLPTFMDRFRSTPFEGASVTIPHKTAVMPSSACKPSASVKSKRSGVSVMYPRLSMLTARGEEEDRVRGLETGADDSLPNHFRRKSWLPASRP